MRTTFTSLLLAGCFIPQITLATTSSQDSTRQSLVEHLIHKDVPRSLQMDLHLKSTFNAQFPNPQSGKDEAKFRFDHLMIDLHGQLTDHLSYKYLQRVHQGVRAFESENLSSSINYAYLTYRFNPRYAITAGRQAVAVGGFEYYEYPIDIYDFSLINGNFTCYLTGLQFNYNPSPKQELCLQVLNNRQGSMSEAFGVLPENIEKPFAPLYYTLAWNSSYAADRFKLRCSATAGEQAKGQWMVLAAAGIRVQSGPFSMYLDQLYTRSSIDHLNCIRNMATAPEENALYTATRHTEYLTTTLDMNYQFTPQWNLHLKGCYERGSVFKSSESWKSGNYLSSWGYQGAVEFFPMKDRNLRIFASMAGRTQRQCRIPEMNTPEDMLKFSLGFCYRLPVL